MWRQSEIKQILRKISAYGAIEKVIRYDEETNAGTVTMQTPTPNEGEEGKETNIVNIRVRQRHMRTKQVQLHTVHRYVMVDTVELGDVLCLMS